MNPLYQRDSDGSPTVLAAMNGCRASPHAARCSLLEREPLAAMVQPITDLDTAQPFCAVLHSGLHARPIRYVLEIVVIDVQCLVADVAPQIR